MTFFPPFPRFRTLLLIVAGFFALGFLIYGWSLDNAFVRWDDGMLIFENPVIRQITPATLKWIFTHFDPELYIPLTFFSYQIDFLIGGMNPFQFHLHSLILHILNAVLVGGVLFALVHRKWLALFCGLLFLVHPLNTEAVEWASGRKDVLSTFFFLASILLYFFYRDRERRGWYIGSLTLFLCGLLSKVMVVSLPVVLVLFELLRGRKPDRKMIMDIAPYVFLSTIFGLVGVLGKQGVLASSTLEDKVLMATKSITFYASHFFYPVHLSLLYPYTKQISLFSADFYVPLLVIFFLVAVVAWTWNRLRVVAIGLLFFLITVIPTLSNFSKGSEMNVYFASDRYAYLPQIGLLIAVAGLAGYLYERAVAVFEKRTLGAAASVAGALVLGVFSILAYKQSLVWKDTKSLFQNVIKLYPDASYVAYNNLCNAERYLGNFAEAADNCRKSLELRPHPKTYSNLGAVYRQLKNYTDAIDAYEKGIALDPESPYPHFGIGIVYAEQGRFSLAEAAYRRALEHKPSYADVHVNLGALNAAQGKFAEAIEDYRTALGINPYLPSALYNLAVAETEIGKTDDAIADYRRAMMLDPSHVRARINLAILLYAAREVDAAAEQFRAVLRIDPDNVSALSALKQMGMN